MYEVDNRTLGMNHTYISIDEVCGWEDQQGMREVETEAAQKKAYGPKLPGPAQNLYSVLLLLE